MLLPATSLASVDAAAYSQYDGKTVLAITFTGIRSTRPWILQRELRLAAGDAFSAAELAGSVRNLENLGIFGAVVPVVAEVPPGVTLEIQCREMPSFVPYLAVSYTEENGFSAGPALASVNFLGRAIRVSGRALFGGTTTAALLVKDPWIAGSSHVGLDLVASHLVRQDELLGFEETSNEFTPWLTRHLGKTGRVRGMAGFFAMQADRDGITLSPDRSDRFFRLGAALGFDTRDSQHQPTQGWENEIEVLGTFGHRGFATANLDLRRFQRLGRGHTLFAGVLTSFQSGTVGEDVPAYLQYRLGGANSIRGQDVDLGKTLFGKNQLITTLEYQIGIVPLRPYDIFRWSAAMGLQLALFTDTGIAWSSSGEFSAGRVKTGFGAGLRLLATGFEMVRFDAGMNAQGDVHLHLGGSFKWTAQRLRLR